MKDQPDNGSIVRFRLRTMFIATAIIAAACAVLTAPLARTDGGLPVIGLGVAVLMTLFGWSVIRQLKIERESGRLLHRPRLVTRPDEFPDLASRKRQRWTSRANAIIFNLLILGQFVALIGMDLKQPVSWLRSAAILGLFAATATLRYWWDTAAKRLEIREQGVMYMLALHPWTEIKRVELTGRSVNNFMFQFKDTRWYVTLESDEAAKLKEIVEQWIGNHQPPGGCDSGSSP
jgi:hypothetical protein